MASQPCMKCRELVPLIEGRQCVPCGSLYVALICSKATPFIDAQGVIRKTNEHFTRFKKVLDDAVA